MTKLDRFLRKNDAVLVASTLGDCLATLSASGQMGSPFYYYRDLARSSYRLHTSLDRALTGDSSASQTPFTPKGDVSAKTGQLQSEAGERRA